MDFNGFRSMLESIPGITVLPDMTSPVGEHNGEVLSAYSMKIHRDDLNTEHLKNYFESNSITSVALYQFFPNAPVSEDTMFDMNTFNEVAITEDQKARSRHHNESYTVRLHLGKNVK